MSGTVLGLDYAAVRATLAMMRVRDVPQVFADLRAMEAAVLSALRDRARATPR